MPSSARSSLYVAAYTCVGLLAAAASCNGPHAIGPALAIVHDPVFHLVSVTGSNFGAPAAGSQVAAFDLTTNQQFAAAATDPAIVLWKDKQVVVELPAAMTNAQIRVETSAGASANVPVEYYRYDYFHTNAGAAQTPGTNPVPLQVAVDGDQRVWALEEFHRDVKRWDPVTAAVERLPIPQSPNPGPFASTLFADHRTQTSTLGEAIALDSHGRVWFTQGGGFLYGGAHPNHSRLVSYEPATGQFFIYNVPGDRNEVIGVAWDEARQAIWFTERWRQEGDLIPYGGRLVAFRPYAAGAVAPDNAFDFSAAAASLTCDGGSKDPAAVGTCSNAAYRNCFTADDCVLADQVCPPDVVDDSTCYHEYALPGTIIPGMIAVHPDGAIWFANYWSDTGDPVELGRLDPSAGAGEVKRFPLHRPIEPWFANGPWDVAVAADGDVLVGEYVENRVVRFDASRVGDPACEAPLAAPAAVSPCAQQKLLDALLATDETVAGGPLVHGVAEDAAGRVWFVQGGEESIASGNAPLVGYVKAGFGDVVAFGPLTRFPPDTADACGGYDGFNGAQVAVDPVSGDVWFADFCRKRLGRLRQL